MNYHNEMYKGKSCIFCPYIRKKRIAPFIF